MKIVDLATFLSYPAGTLFAKYEPCVFEELCVKGDSLLSSNDFFYSEFSKPQFIDADNSDHYFDILGRIEAGEPSPPLDLTGEGRDGCFEKDQLFAVYERADIEAMRDRLIGLLQSTTLDKTS